MTRIPVSTALVTLALCALWIMLGSRTLPMARQHDFLNLYTGGSLALSGRFADLHDVEVQLDRERQIVPDLPQLVPFVRPVYYAAALAPMALLPYNMAFVVWIAMQSALLLACWIWAWRRFGPDSLIFAALFLPAPLGIATGQDCVVMLALLIAAFELSERGSDRAAGAVLGLMLLKFHLVLLWPVAIVVQRRWRMLAGFVAATVVEAAVSLALGGVSDARLYVALLRNKNLDHLSPSPELMVSYQGFFANLGVESTWLPAALIIAVIGILIFAVRNAPLYRMFVLAPLASLIIVPHVYGYDATMLTLPILLMIFKAARPVSRIAATLFSTPLPFGFALAGKPWAIIASASLLGFFVISVVDRSALNTPGRE
jgi:hypothetical protein